MPARRPSTTATTPPSRSAKDGKRAARAAGPVPGPRGYDSQQTGEREPAGQPDNLWQPLDAPGTDHRAHGEFDQGAHPGVCDGAGTRVGCLAGELSSPGSVTDSVIWTWLAVLATALLLGPVAYHRMVFRRGEKKGPASRQHDRDCGPGGVECCPALVTRYVTSVCLPLDHGFRACTFGILRFAFPLVRRG
jgi:hypothetical protein